MHSFAHHHQSTAGAVPATETQGRVLDSGWRYDLQIWFLDTFMLRGKLRELRQKTTGLARIRRGETVLEVGCGTGTLAIAVQQRVGATGHVCGIDPGPQQIARARAKAARRHAPIDFQIGAIEQLAFPDQTFDAVLSSLMMHHVPEDLQRRGLAEIARVLKPGGRLLIADFIRPEGRPAQPVRRGSGASNMQDLAALVQDAGFAQLEMQEMRLPRLPAHSGSGVGFLRAYKSEQQPIEPDEAEP